VGDVIIGVGFAVFGRARVPTQQAIFGSIILELGYNLSLKALDWLSTITIKTKILDKLLNNIKDMIGPCWASFC